MISPPKRPASASASALFPVAVDPRTATTREGEISDISRKKRERLTSSDANEDVGDEDEQQDEEPDLLRPGQHFSNARMHQCTNAPMRFVHLCIRAFVHFVLATGEFRCRKTSP